MDGCDNIDTLFDKESLTDEYIDKAPLYIPCIDLVIEIPSQPCSHWLQGFFNRLPDDQIESLTLQASSVQTYNYFTLDDAQDLQSICNWIKNAKCLKRIVIRNMHFLEKQAKIISQALRSNNNLIDLELTQYNRIYSE